MDMYFGSFMGLIVLLVVVIVHEGMTRKEWEHEMRMALIASNGCVPAEILMVGE